MRATLSGGCRCLDLHYVGGAVLAFQGPRFVAGPVYFGSTLSTCVWLCRIWDRTQQNALRADAGFKCELRYGVELSSLILS